MMNLTTLVPSQPPMPVPTGNGLIDTIGPRHTNTRIHVPVRSTTNASVLPTETG